MPNLSISEERHYTEKDWRQEEKGETEDRMVGWHHWLSGHEFEQTSGVSGRRQWQPTPVLLPGKSHGQRSLVDCGPWGRKELDTTERLPFHFSLSCIGEGNGNPLQCSCLGNPRDGGSWWAAVCGVTQSRTRLKWLSSSSSIPSLYQLGTRHTFQIATTQNI